MDEDASNEPDDNAEESLTDEEYIRFRNKRKKSKKHRKNKHKSHKHYEESYYNNKQYDHPKYEPPRAHISQFVEEYSPNPPKISSIQELNSSQSCQQYRPIRMADTVTNFESKSQFNYINKENFNNISTDPSKLIPNQYQQSNLNQLDKQDSYQSITISDLIADQQKRIKMKELYSNGANNLESESGILYNESKLSSSSSPKQSNTDLSKDQLCEYAYIVYKPGSNYIAMSRSLNELIPPDTTVIYKMDETSNKKDKQRIKSQSLIGNNKLKFTDNDSNRIKVSLI